MAQLSLSNVINVSVSEAQLGVGEYSVNNIGLFSTETAGSSFGTQGYQIYLDPSQVETDFGTDSETFAMANAIFSQQPNVLNGNGYLTVITQGSAETLAAAITRTASLVQYFGILSTNILNGSQALAAAAVVQPLNKMLLVPSFTSSDMSTGSPLQAIVAAGYTQTRPLYYGGGSSLALNFAASYAGLAFSTNFDGNNTTQTMHLKNLVGVAADTTMTQTLLNTAVANGIDTYPSLQGVPKVFTSGANSYFDQVYGQLWLAGALQVAAFNYLAESATKVPQNEEGMNGFKGAIRQVMAQAVTNQFLAPGQWNSSTTFGTQTQFLTNISNFGYYIYSAPVSQQSQADRASRIAPLVQIAGKEAGAIQSADLIVYLNP